VDSSVDFCKAFEALKNGCAITRWKWGDKAKFLFYVRKHEGFNFAVDRPYIAIKEVNGSIEKWNPLQDDILANDWVVMTA